MEVKSNIGEVTKDTKELTNEASKAAGEFQIMGVSLNGVKKGFASAAVTAKGMFGSIKAGLISTGIGAFVVLIGSLAAYLTNTKKGAELLEKTLKTVGAAISVITDRVAKLGGAVVKFLRGDLKGAAEDAKAAVSGVVAEINAEVSATMKMVTANQKLRDSQRKLNVETAQSVADIEKLKLIAEDITKSYKEREEAATQAFEKESELESKRIALAEQAVELEVERHRIMGKDGVLAEDLDVLAELEINLANVRQESAGRQISLQNFLNGLREQEKTAKIAEMEQLKIDKQLKLDAIQDQIDAEQKLYDAQIAQADAFEVRVKAQADREKAIAKDLENFKKATLQQGFGAAAAMAGENVALSKGVAAAQVIYNTQQGIMAAMGATSIADKLLPYPLRLANAISTGVMGAAALSTIMSTSPTGGSNNPAPNTGGGGTPAPQMMSGAFDISGGVAPEPLEAFVITDKMTSSQNQLANIRRRATI